MKKLWLAMMFVVVLLCWGVSAIADVEYNEYCDVCNNRFCYMGFMDGGDYHWKITSKCGYKEQLPHVVECGEMKCIDCGNTTGLTGVEITHVKNKVYIDMGGWSDLKYIYTFDENKHVLKCFCGEVTFEDDYHTPPSCLSAAYNGIPAGTCIYCDVEEALILEDRMQHYWYDAESSKCYCGATRVERLPGDADNNSSVTLADARAILSDNVSSESNADVTGDGSVDTQDVLRIMQYLAGWDVTLQ